MLTHRGVYREVAASIDRLGAHGTRVVDGFNAMVDHFIGKCLALVVRRLNVVAESVDRVDGGRGLGIRVAALMARMAGFEVREAPSAASQAGSYDLFRDPMVPARAQRRTAARARCSRASSISNRLHPSVWSGIPSPAMAAVYRRPMRMSEAPAGAVRSRSSSDAMN